MTTLPASGGGDKNGFRAVVAPFLQQDGLPFAEVLSAQDIEEAFAQRGALFAQDEIFSTPLVLWAFLAQVLHDGKGAACAAAVEAISLYLLQVGGKVPSGDTGDYCRARAKLDLSAIQHLVRQSARQLEDQADPSWLWHGLYAKLIDGFTFTMPDTPDNQLAFPQSDTQEPGVGLPIARACVILSLATAALCDLNLGPYQGKGTGETALLRGMFDSLDPGDVAVLDRYFCSFLLLAMLRQRGVEFCTRLHQCRSSDFREGRQLGEEDHIVIWTRPERPEWMPENVYEGIPETMTLREMQFHLDDPDCRADTITVITSLANPKKYPKEDIAALYGCRWNVELDIREIKQALHLDHVRCKTPHMVVREVWVTLLAYNLIRKVIATAAAVHDKQPRRLGFTLACQAILTSWILLSTGACRDARLLWDSMLERIAANEVANRPGRVEPRVLKRRRHRYPLMNRRRDELRQKLTST